MMKVVGNCPQCGAPIYADTQVGDVPGNIFTCDCRLNRTGYPCWPQEPIYPNPYAPTWGTPFNPPYTITCGSPEITEHINSGFDENDPIFKERPIK